MTTPADDDLPEGLVVPDDLSSLFASEPDAPRDDEAQAPGAPAGQPPDPDPVIRTTAVVLTRVRQAKVLAGLMALAGIDAAVVPSKRGAIAVRYVEQEAADVDPAEALSGIPVAAEALGAALSVATRAETVLLAGRVDEVNGEISGQVRARVYQGGQIAGQPPPGLVLASADIVAERLLIGVVQAPEIPGYISSTDLGGGPSRGFFGRRRRDGGTG